MLDLFIVGGGINGVGIAVDAAGRGLSVTLCEQDDLACATSSKSSKLIHGGLRYLEYYEFRLVREALVEREVLLKKAPHIISPLRFIMPHNAQLKPAWMLRLGLFLYDHLGRRTRLPSSAGLNLTTHPAGKMLRNKFTKGFIYSDCWVDDSRLVVLNALDAQARGAKILTRQRFVSARRQENYWQIEIEDAQTMRRQQLQAKAIVNAAGPWVEEIIHGQFNLPSQNQVSLVKGSHIVVPRFYKQDYAFTLINSDNRVVFVIPFLQQFTLIGTTDIPYTGDPFSAAISSEEVNYLSTAINKYFEKTLKPEDVKWSYSGVRALHKESEENPSAISRDYVLELNAPKDQAPLLSIFGGKITTYRKLAEHALQELKNFFPEMKGEWTANTSLPGGDIGQANFSNFFQAFRQQYPWLPGPLAYRYARSYGTLATKFLINHCSLNDLGRHYGAGLYQIELDYLIGNEWVKSAEDVLWRRSKLGLFMTEEQVKELERAIH